MRVRLPRRLCVLPLLALLGAGAALAQAKPPKTQLWLDLSTGGMAGMPDMDMGLGGALGGLMGRMGGGAMGMGGNTTYGLARGPGGLSRVVDIALYNSLKPGVEASQAIPPGMRMGDSLPLVPPRSQAAAKSPEPGEPGEQEVERPKGRILIYWGCSAAVRTGQPRVIDLAGNPAAFAGAFAGRFAPDRGARVNASYALYPNEKNKVSVGKDSSLVGEHQVLGDGVPASMKFTLGAHQDLMPRIELQSTGHPRDVVSLNWQALAQARAYFLGAFGAVGDDMVMWSSAEVPDTGMGLFDYLPNPTIDRWLKEKVLLAPSTTSCQIPKGIFAARQGGKEDEAGGAMVRMIAYGSESSIVHPPRPSDPKAPWEPEWAVRVRVKSQTMAALGGEVGGAMGGGPMGGRTAAPPAGPAAGAEAPAVSPLPNPVNLLKGLFGR